MWFYKIALCGKADMEIKNLLPIGSVVQLAGAEKKLMIYGVKQTDNESGAEYDYIGVIYPEGNIGQETQFLFNHNHIEEIIYRGYEDEEREDFIEKLSAYYGEEK